MTSVPKEWWHIRGIELASAGGRWVLSGRSILVIKRLFHPALACTPSLLSRYFTYGLDANLLAHANRLCFLPLLKLVSYTASPFMMNIFGYISFLATHSHILHLYRLTLTPRSATGMESGCQQKGTSLCFRIQGVHCQRLQIQPVTAWPRLHTAFLFDTDILSTIGSAKS